MKTKLTSTRGLEKRRKSRCAQRRNTQQNRKGTGICSQFLQKPNPKVHPSPVGSCLAKSVLPEAAGFALAGLRVDRRRIGLDKQNRVFLSLSLTKPSRRGRLWPGQCFPPALSPREPSLLGRPCQPDSCPSLLLNSARQPER